MPMFKVLKSQFFLKKIKLKLKYFFRSKFGKTFAPKKEKRKKKKETVAPTMLKHSRYSEQKDR
jgi:hypothetical protein